MKRFGRRGLTFALAAVLCLTAGIALATEDISASETASPSTAQEETQMQQTENPNLATRVPQEEDHYIFELDESVERTQVYFTNRYGIELAGDLYVAKDADLSQSHPGLVIGPPFGGVKEQGPGVYANELAQRGFVVLAFDPSFHGYSGGQPRYTGSSDFYAEDFSAGVDYLGTLGYVDRARIGAIGICGSGGFALSAAAADARIQAVAAIVMYDIAGLGNSSTGEARQQMLAQLAQARWDEVDNGPSVNFSYPDQPTEAVPDGMQGAGAEFYSFYGTQRGWHPNALGNVTATSNMSLANFPSLTHIGDISPPAHPVRRRGKRPLAGLLPVGL